MSEKILVVEIDLRNDGDLGNDHIRRIQPPAHAHLNHSDFRACARKEIESHGCNALEVGRMSRKRPGGQ